jgi:hypothetical protein
MNAVSLYVYITSDPPVLQQGGAPVPIQATAALAGGTTVELQFAMGTAFLDSGVSLTSNSVMVSGVGAVMFSLQASTNAPLGDEYLYIQYTVTANGYSSTATLPAFPVRIVEGPPLSYPTPNARKICQLTGDTDNQRKQANLQADTASMSATNAGVRSTDLGIPVYDTFRQRLYFFFGDTVPCGSPDVADDCIAWADVTDAPGLSYPPKEPLLHWIVGPDTPHLFQPISIANYRGSYAGFFTPAGGFFNALNNAVYLFYGLTGGDPDSFSVLAKSTDDCCTFFYLYTLTSSNFVQCVSYVAPASAVPGAPLGGPVLLVWGTSKDYRRSRIYLAFCPLADIDNVEDVDPYTGESLPGTSWRYYAGLKENGMPNWVPADMSIPIFDVPEVGEMSVTYEPRTGLWLMMYGAIGGLIKMLYSPRPWGPWTNVSTANDDGVIFDPTRDGTDPNSGEYRSLTGQPKVWPPRFIHVVDQEDGLYEVYDKCGPSPDRYLASDGGGPYAPYMIPPWFRTVGDRLTVFFTLSLWLPYQVVLMRVDLDAKFRIGA